MLDRLVAGHRQLEELAARIADLLDADVPDMDGLSAARWAFATRLMQHLALEDRHLYANLAASPDPAIAAAGRKAQDDHAVHLADFADHARHWTAARVAMDWAGYRAATRAQLASLRQRIASAERALYPLAAVGIADAGHPSRSWAREAFQIKASIAAR